MPMIHPTSVLLWCLGAFLAGSIPFGLLLVKLAGKGDVRQTGSGNIGATNVMRAGGKGLGILTLALDVAKGFLPVYLARRYGLLPTHLLAVIALMAVVGHMFTPWLKFKGGKGVATALGVALAYHPMMVVPSLGVFLALVLIFRYISLGSIVAAVVLVLAAVGLLGPCFHPGLQEAYADYSRWLVLAWTVLAILVIRAHSANIQRLLQGTESKFWGAKKENPESARD